jgi:hypothetical protein
MNQQRFLTWVQVKANGQGMRQNQVADDGSRSVIQLQFEGAKEDVLAA